MTIQVTGHNFAVTDAIKETVNSKLGSIKKHFSGITSIKVYLNVNRDMQEAEATVHVPGAELFAKADSEDMYKTIELLGDKLMRQLDKYKAKLHNH